LTAQKCRVNADGYFIPTIKDTVGENCGAKLFTKNGPWNGQILTTAQICPTGDFRGF